jgi:hypothetical protein
MSSTPDFSAGSGESAAALIRAIEIVDGRQHVANQIGGDGIAELAPLAFGALAIVVEFGRGAEEPILQFVALPA